MLRSKRKAGQTIARRPRLAATVLVVGLVAGLGAGCANPSPAPGRRLLVIGDSLTFLEKDIIEQGLRDAGWDPTIQSLGGTTLEFWGPGLAKIVAESRPDVAVIELGTNECQSDACPDLQPLIDGMMRTMADIHAVLWANVQDDIVYPKHGDYVNYAISAADARWPNMFPVDLASLMHGHPEWRRPDGLHLNDAGALQYTALLVRELQPFLPAP